MVRKKLPERLREEGATFRFAGADWPMGPKLAALPNEHMKAFVVSWCHLVNQAQHGSRMQAAKLAGYDCKPENLKFQSYALLQRDDILEAIHEQDVRRLAVLGGKALRAVEGQLDSPMAKGHLKAAEMIMDRAFPLASIIKYQHETIQSPQDEALQLFQDMRASGIAREVLEHTFGAIGCARYERMLSESAPAKTKKHPDVVDVTAVEVKDEDW